jgi:hypothetical protein
MTRGYDNQVIPASSVPRVPQSVARFAPQSVGSSSNVKATPAYSRPAILPSSAVQGTPCRGTTQSRLPDTFLNSFENHDVVLPSSPLQSRHENNRQFLTVTGHSVQDAIFRTPTRTSKIQATPVKGIAFNIENEDPLNSVISTPLFGGTKTTGTENLESSGARPGNGESIYKALGWDNDDFDDELA